MSLLFSEGNKFYAPDDKSISGQEMGSREILDLLNEDDDKDESLDLNEDKDKDEKKIKDKEDIKDEDEKKEGEEEEDSDIKALKDIEDELEDDEIKEDDEKLELRVPVRKRDILKKYPDLFKDFPYLESSYYRERQYTEIVPTIDDAKEAVRKAGILDNFEKDLMSGNTETVLDTIKKNDPEAFNKVVDNYLVTLAKVDRDAYHHVSTNIIKHAIIAMVRESKASDNKALETAATVLNQFIFGSSEFTPPTNLHKPKNNEGEDKLAEERKEFVKERFETSRDDLSTRIDNVLKSTIDGNIDPKGSMTSYIKKTASKDALENLQNLMNKDKGFAVIKDKLWDRALDLNFNKESMDKIKSAYLSKAKSLLPSVIKKARIEALRGMGKRIKDDVDEKEDSSNKEDKGKSALKLGNSTSSSNSGKTLKDKARAIPAHVTSRDYLMQD